MNWPGRKSRAAGRSRNKERVSAPWSTTSSSRPSSSTAMSGDLVDRVLRDPDHDLGVRVFDHRLAAETRRRRESRALVEQVLLGVLRSREMLHALLADHVAGRPPAGPAA